MKKIVLEIQENKDSLNFNWEKNFVLSVTPGNSGIIINGNKEGLISLAKNIIALAEENIPNHYNFTLDDQNSLEEESIPITFTKSEDQKFKNNFVGFEEFTDHPSKTDKKVIKSKTQLWTKKISH